MCPRHVAQRQRGIVAIAIHPRDQGARRAPTVRVVSNASPMPPLFTVAGDTGAGWSLSVVTGRVVVTGTR